jgi:uncharacterized protein (DUF2147 family)
VSSVVVYAPAVPLVIIQLLLRERWPGIQNLYDDWANVAYYTTYLFAGFLFARSPALEKVAQAEWRRALLLGVVTSGVLLGGLLRVYESTVPLLAGSAIAGWCFVVAALGLARRFLEFGNATLHYLSEAAFPIYILHQAAIVVPGYFLVRLPIGVAAKFLLILAVAVIVTFGVYHFIVREVAAARFVFGMRPRVERIRQSAPRSAIASMVVLAVVATANGEVAEPEGLWYAEGGAATVRVEACGEGLCGRVESLRSPFDENGCALRDVQNADLQLRERPIEGLEIFRGLRPAPGEANVWAGGTIYDPTSGRTYRCRLTVDGDRLYLRGYVGLPVLGRTATWIRVGAQSRTCRQATLDP